MKLLHLKQLRNEHGTYPSWITRNKVKKARNRARKSKSAKNKNKKK